MGTAADPVAKGQVLVARAPPHGATDAPVTVQVPADPVVPARPGPVLMLHAPQGVDVDARRTMADCTPTTNSESTLSDKPTVRAEQHVVVLRSRGREFDSISEAHPSVVR